jgi:AcrR family transcriptional regulator
MQQIADRADVAIGTLYRYASTKAELLIMLQNQKFATAIDDGLIAAAAATGAGRPGEQHGAERGPWRGPSLLRLAAASTPSGCD